MPPPETPPLTRTVVLRGLGFGVAIALGAVAVWLIVISDSTRSIRLGVLAGIWGALLGAYSMFGARRHGLEFDEANPQQRSPSDVPVMSAQEIALRSTGEVERIAEAAARRAFEERLEQMMRRELSREVGGLRGEIARLRQDLLDKVGGQLRLERIETTRVIGSDLEALQHEVRQLKQASETGTLHEFGIGTGPQHIVVEPARVRPTSRPVAETFADVKPARVEDELPPAPAPTPALAAVEAEPVAPPAAVRAASGIGASTNGASTNGASANGASANGAVANGAAANGAHLSTNGRSSNGASSNGASDNGASDNGASGRPQAPRPAESTAPPHVSPPQIATPHTATTKQPPRTKAQPAAATSHGPKPADASTPPGTSADPFASLPRIRPFTEFELDPIDTGDRHGTAADAPHPEPGKASPVAPANAAYTGRRRRTDGTDADAGRHSRHDTTPTAVVGGRRRRVDDPDDSDDDLLSRLLARGTADH